MKIDLSRQLTTITGEAFKQMSPSGALIDMDCSLRTAILTALIAQLQTDAQLPAQKKLQLYRLAQKINSAEAIIDLSAEEIVAIKERANSVHGIQFYGALDDALEAKQTPDNPPFKEPYANAIEPAP
jgi:hypothetical protein